MPTAANPAAILPGLLQPSASQSSSLLPSVDCVRVITNYNATDVRFQAFIDEARRVGLWDRTTVQQEALDPEGGRVGCFRAHVNAWRAGVADNCEHLLVVEDDVAFDESQLFRWNRRAEDFLRSRTPYDMIFPGFDLGWGNTLAASTSGAKVKKPRQKRGREDD